MAVQLVEGEAFTDHFTLLEKISETSTDESWLAIIGATGDRVFLKIFLALADEDWPKVTRSIDATRGLVHENINRVTEHGEFEGLKYIAEPFLKGGTPLSPTGLQAGEIWPVLKQLLSALHYAHRSGFAHGDLHPGNLIVDNMGNLHITGFGAPVSPLDKGRYGRYLSPQILDSQPADTTDDIYSLGALIFASLTGKEWQVDIELDQPLPNRVETLLAAMLDRMPYERNIDLLDVEAILAEHFEKSDQTISSVAFEREVPQPEPREDAGPVFTRQQHRVSTTSVVMGLVGIVALALALFLLLPDTAEISPSTLIATPDVAQEEPTRTREVPAEATPALAPFEAARLEFMAEEGKNLAREILKKQIQLEDTGVFLWADETFAALTGKLDDADELYRIAEYDAALSSYEEIAAGLDELIKRGAEELATQLALGDQALIDGDFDTAIRAFTIANAIKRNDESIGQRLERAENLETVISLMREGEMEERNGDFDRALKKYQEAASLDGEWQDAVMGVGRIREAITQRRFTDAMSEAFTALAAKDYTPSREAFGKAQQIMPNSAEPADGLLQVEQAIRTDTINQHRAAADGYLEESRWVEAASEYEAALAIDSTLVFAEDGLAYANSRQDIDEQLQRYLADPTLMQQDEGLQAARKTLAIASRTDPKSPQMSDYIDTLARLISNARVEVPVTITSDNKTDITVLKVVSLGKLSTDVLRLIPGRYTIKGERLGYRDVRIDLTIVAGQPVPPITVACTEKI